MENTTINMKPKKLLVLDTASLLADHRDLNDEELYEVFHACLHQKEQTRRSCFLRFDQLFSHKSMRAGS